MLIYSEKLGGCILTDQRIADFMVGKVDRATNTVQTYFSQAVALIELYAVFDPIIEKIVGCYYGATDQLLFFNINLAVHDREYWLCQIFKMDKLRFDAIAKRHRELAAVTRKNEAELKLTQKDKDLLRSLRITAPD